MELPGSPPRATCLRFGVRWTVAVFAFVFGQRTNAADTYTWRQSSIQTQWNTSSANWRSPTLSLTTWVNGNDAVFPTVTNHSLSLTQDITANSLNFTGDGYTLSSTTGNTLTLTGTASIQTSAGITATISVPLAGNSGLTKQGAGTLVLNGINTYSGGTVISAGTLTASNLPQNSSVYVDPSAVFNASNLGSNIIGSLSGGGLVNLSSSLTAGGNNDWTTFFGAITGNGGLTKQGFGTLTLYGSLSYTGATIVQGGTLDASATTLPLHSSVTVSSGGTLLLGSNNNLGGMDGSGVINFSNTLTVELPNVFSFSTFSGALQGAGSFVKTGSGTLNLNSFNNYSGDTFINGGTLVAPNLPDTTAVTIAAGATYQAFTDTIGSLSGAGTLQLHGPLTFGGTHASTQFDGSIGGSGDLIKDGSGTFSLSGSFNNFFGNVTVNEGTLRLLNSNVLPTSTRVSVSASATFDLNDRNATIASLEGAGTVALGSGTLTLNGSNDTEFSGALSGFGTLIKQGFGMLTLSGNNFNSVQTQVQAGRVHVTGSMPASRFDVTSSGTLSGTGQIGSLYVAGGGTLSPGNSPGTLTASSALWSVGGNYVWEVNQATGLAGTNWDLLNVNGSLTIGANSSSPFHLALRSLLPDNSAGSVINFNPIANYSYTIATTTFGITGFNPSAFTIDTSGFANTFGGTWSVALNGNNLDLVYTAIPEPTATAALAGCVVLGAVHWRRRQRRPRQGAYP